MQHLLAMECRKPSVVVDMLGLRRRHHVAGRRTVEAGHNFGRILVAAAGCIVAALGSRRNSLRDLEDCLRHIDRIHLQLDRVGIHLDVEDRTSLVVAVGRNLAPGSRLVGCIVAEGTGWGRCNPVVGRNLAHRKKVVAGIGRSLGCCMDQTSWRVGLLFLRYGRVTVFSGFSW